MPLPTSSAPRRRRHVRATFDRTTEKEWERYAREPHRVLRRVLRERFLELHLRSRPRTVLELGPGPGRFTRVLLEQRPRRLVAVDLSREGLRAGRQRYRRWSAKGVAHWVQAAGEHLPLDRRSVDAAVVLGNIVCFAVKDGSRMLGEIARVLRPGGMLVVDFQSPAGAVQDFLWTASNRRLLPKVLRDPRYYLLDDVLETGFQPYDPRRLSRWEFQFYTPSAALAALARAGFRPLDTLAIAPVAAYQPRVASIAQRDPRTWATLLRVEEEVGRRPGALETGHGFVVAAVRR